MKYLSAFLAGIPIPPTQPHQGASGQPARSAQARPLPTDKTDKSPHAPLLSVLSVPSESGSQKSTPQRVVARIEPESEPLTDPVAARHLAVLRAWREAYARLDVGYPEDARSTLESLAPALVAEWDAAENAAETASMAYVAYVDDETRSAAFKAALALWEATVVKAVRYITTRCHTCQKEATVTFVTDYGARTCARCFQEATAPTAPRASAKTKPPRKPSLPPSRPDLFNRRR
jgi:hypothetical protein